MTECSVVHSRPVLHTGATEAEAEAEAEAETTKIMVDRSCLYILYLGWVYCMATVQVAADYLMHSHPHINQKMLKHGTVAYSTLDYPGHQLPRLVISQATL